MTVSPDIAVIVPAYKAEGTLDAALASVASQTSQPSEVVVADDHSPDATAAVAARWSSVLPLRVLRQASNLGPAAARRRAIEESTASLIALLDADDLWLPDHLAQLEAAIGERGTVASGDGYRWRPGVGIGRRTHRDVVPIPDADDQPMSILRANFVFVGALFHRADYQAAGGFRDGFSGAEDWDLWIRMIRGGVRVAGSQSPTVIYRVAESGLSHGSEIFDTYLRVLEVASQESELERERHAIAEVRGRYEARRALAEIRTAVRDDGRTGTIGLRREVMKKGTLETRVEALIWLYGGHRGASIVDLLRRKYR